jgi:hypothetical protein
LRHLYVKLARRRASVEALDARIAQLVAHRQQLRAQGARPATLERNRRRLVRAQWQLGLALIDRHLPDAATQSAA